ncbi:hypothetical protein GCM10010327_56210 [Streptomyces nitrosporeus]|nr:hypothetical protein GCM10010327_56210 [Streptomyces nitrosporeus]
MRLWSLRSVVTDHRAVELYRAGPEDDRSSGDPQTAHLDLARASLASGEPEEAVAKLSEVFAAETYTASITIRLRDLAAFLGSEPYRGVRSAAGLRAHIYEAAGRPTLTGNLAEPR